MLEQREEVGRDATPAHRGEGPPRQLPHRQHEGRAEHRQAHRGGGHRPEAPERLRLQGAARPAALDEPGPAARAVLEQEQRQGEEQQHARELGGRDPIEHAVPDAIDGLGQRAIAERRDGPEVGERFHHRERHPRREGGPRHRHRHREERGRARAAEGARDLHRGGALLAEGHPGQEVDVRVEDQGHHGDHPAVGAQLGQPGARAERAAQRALDRSRVLEETEEGEADDVGRHRERQDQRPLQHRAPGEAVEHHEPGEAAADQQRARPHPQRGAGACWRSARGAGCARDGARRPPTGRPATRAPPRSGPRPPRRSRSRSRPRARTRPARGRAPAGYL